MSETIHGHERNLIDRHFAGRASPGTDSAMRAHLGDCAGCRDYYDRHALLAEMDPRALGAEERLAAGLGFHRGAAPRALWPALALAGATAAFVIFAHARRASDADPEFSARGSLPPLQPAPLAAAPPSIEVYRASAGTTTRMRAEASTTIAADDELAFAYRNPTGHARLVVAGVDEQGRVYWYHPDPDVTETAIAIERHDDARELPEAIRHQYQGSRLRILGVFGDEGLSVQDLRGRIDASGCDGLVSRQPQLVCVDLDLTVKTGSSP